MLSRASLDIGFGYFITRKRRHYYKTVSAVNMFVVSATVTIPFLGYEKSSLFCVGCYRPIPKIIIGIGCLCQPTLKINFQYSKNSQAQI
jgi:hypothetical protein